MKQIMTVAIMSLLTFSFSVSAADKGAFYCHSEMMKPYQSYEKAYVQSISCEEVRSVLGGRAKEKAVAECNKWANGLSLANHTTQYFDKSSHGEDFYGICHNESGRNFDNLRDLKMNSVTAFPRLNEYPGGSKIVWSYLFVNNFENQNVILRQDGSEQAQWIKALGQKYCGFLNLNIAFLEGEKSFKLLRPGTGDEGEYSLNLVTNNYEAVTKLDGLNADYLHYKLESHGPSYMTFFNLVDNHRSTVAKFEIFYSEYRRDCE